MLTETERLDKMKRLGQLLGHIDRLLSEAEDALNATPEDFALKKIEAAREAITECCLQFLMLHSHRPESSRIETLR